MTQLTSEQLKNLILYHAANARFHNTQAHLAQTIVQPEAGHDDVFAPIAELHTKMAARHKNMADILQAKLGTTQNDNME